MMKVAVIGANGKIGQHLVEQMQHAKTHEVIAVVRKEAQQKALQERGLTAKLADLEGPVSELKSLLKDVDAVVFTAGSGGNTGDDKTLLVDLDGAVKTIEAAEASGVKRFVMVSAWQSNNRENWAEDLRPYYAAKHYADRELMRSKLSWTIVRPGALTDEEATGKVVVGDSLAPGTVPREDVASVLRRCLDENGTEFRAFDLMAGESEVEQSLQSMKEMA
ncbi:SDR family oxidoreductase [Idiomarina sp. HP20-50]|uniref:SDR family oxidoreductase n=1 Tax=Idiomarina sp. HP20-50 TaxID=3070813 RepID=UPI00294B0813|nr:SDR family oxidoreductase [Idiomarina sp. HP20-50]MDV6316618.1 SDR family oxidoreductase [Idiomarina sp. HP20-50]